MNIQNTTFTSFSNSDVRKCAREQLKNTIGNGVLFTLSYFGIGIALLLGFLIIAFPIGLLETSTSNTGLIIILNLFMFVVEIGMGIVMCVLNYGLFAYFLKLARGEEVHISTLFSGFKISFKLFSIMLLSQLLIMAGVFALIIPGYIIAIAVSQVLFVVVDKPELGPIEALYESYRMMRGYKWKFFCLIFSFIGWIFLSNLTLGAGYLVLMPYMFTSFAIFYDTIKKNYDENLSSRE